jgi:hypothetical protein
LSGEQGQQTQLPETYGPAEISTQVKEERFRIQTWIGASVASVAIATLLAVVGLVAYLAIDNRPAAYIEDVVQPLQPFLLPAIGAVVGYALGARDQE